MPIIYSYPLINTVKDSDQFIISVAPTDSEDTFETRNVTYETLRDNILAGSTSGTVESITFVAPLTGGTITDTGSVSLPQANSSTDGYISSTDWTAFNAKQNISEKGQANGYAPLNAFTKIDTQYLPSTFVGAVVYQGTWNAGTNTPALPSPAPANQGFYYVVSDPGTYLGITYGIGDWVISNGTAWEKVDNSQSVTSVNGQQGVVVLTTSDIAEGTNLYYTDARVALAPSVVANTAKVSFPGFGTTAGTALEGNTVIPPAYTDADVDAHLNVSTANIDQVLSWSGVDYSWVNQSGGGSGSVTEITTSGGLTGGPITSTGDISIDPTGTIGAGTYGSTFSSVKINEIEVDAYGRIVSISTGSTGSGSGTMSSFNVTNGSTSGVMSDNGTFQISGSSGVDVSLSGSGNAAVFSVTNTDRGSAQNIYKNFRADTGGTATANVNNDTIVIAGGTNIETNRNGDTITINAVGGNTDTTYSYTSTQSTNDVDLTLTGSDASTSTVKLVAGSNVTLTDNGSNQVTIDAATGTGVGGSGTQNYIPIWSTTSTIGNSTIFQDGTNIGINTTSINAALDVNGNIKAKSSSFPVFQLEREAASTTGAHSGFYLRTFTNSGSIQDGFGGGIVFSLTNAGSSTNTAAKIYAVRNGGDTTADLQFYGGLDGTVNFANMISTGQLELPGYGGGSFTGTATKSLAVNAGGDVIEIDVTTSNVQSNWNATSGAAEILNKPTDLVSGTTQSQTAVTQIRTLTSAEYQAITPAADVLYIIV
tara:strand:- start:13675 stop:15963 length:2289 start_codon:yes stop_codon:yes gene_type:complete